jgi:ATP-dependent RNA helicase DDX56/DBP9
LNASHVDLSESLDSLVIDEADLILSYGYDEDMKAILALLPPIYQSYLMSATMSPDVDELKQLVLRNPAVLKLEEANDPHLLTQYVVRCTEQDKYLLTFFILKLKVHPFGSGKCILFVNSIDRCYRLKLFLEQFGVKCCTLNSELPLKSRFHIVQEFNRGVYDFIIATDESGDLKFKEVDSDEEEETVTKEGTEESKDETGDEPPKKRQKKTKKKSKDLEYGVSRGIDFKNVQAVINFDVPRTSRSYMHRVGRTARGVGNKGFALTFLEEDAETAAPIGKGTGSDTRVVTQGSVFKRIEKRQTRMSFSHTSNHVL